jgi:hypothetical protein
MPPSASRCVRILQEASTFSRWPSDTPRLTGADLIRPEFAEATNVTHSRRGRRLACVLGSLEEGYENLDQAGLRVAVLNSSRVVGASRSGGKLGNLEVVEVDVERVLRLAFALALDRCAQEVGVRRSDVVGLAFRPAWDGRWRHRAGSPWTWRRVDHSRRLSGALPARDTSRAILLDVVHARVFEPCPLALLLLHGMLGPAAFALAFDKRLAVVVVLFVDLAGCERLSACRYGRLRGQIAAALGPNGVVEAFGPLRLRSRLLERIVDLRL